MNFSSAIDRDDSVDGRGKEIQFSYFWDRAKAKAYLADFKNADVDWEALTQINFDVNVRGGWPAYEDWWRIEVQALSASGRLIWYKSRNGFGSEAGEDVHMQADTREVQ